MDLGAFFLAAPDAYLVLDRDLRIVTANDAYCDAAGITRTAVAGLHLFEVFPDNPDDPMADGVSNLRASLERVLAHRVPDMMAVQKYDVRDAQGRFVERYWSPRNTPILDPAGEVRWIIHRVEDVTTRVKLGLPVTTLEVEAYARRTSAALASAEEQLRQAQKLDAIGRLAGGVAHDFNNILSVIMSGVEFIRADAVLEGRTAEDLEQIEAAAVRAAELTRQLLAFSRQQVLDPQVVSPGQVVEGLRPMLERLLGENIHQRVQIAPDAGEVRADRGQLEQVLVNLAVNARDAMPKGGTLTFAVEGVELSESYAEGRPEVPPGTYVLMTVSDTGTGMDPLTRSRAFEPFFTTKPKGQGTGLGLSTVFGIVRQSGGYVWLYSELGLGTTVKVYLPRHTGAGGELPTTGRTPIPTGTERVLVVEDETGVRNAVVRLLERLGYDASGTGSPPEAIRRCTDPGERPVLVITDVVMPKVSGRDLADRLRLAAPGLKVLYMSGYTDDVILQQGILAEGVPFLSKPITLDALGRKVREVLDSEGSASGW